ncbi:DEAD/DEAH box helicase family protein [Shouchella lonarensis]|uniref:Type III restriction enzyme, res subunit n=1 Tax=Shouchella lonarensis TaxID=1464122 RepID=A0A1G6GYD9_9BACI|nr:DEAD/DEAH box helicase family protein [Shouchella lonarensis]SDB87009.1 Type III restriction enzyme, res subunit [Shouchella lonarensis]
MKRFPKGIRFCYPWRMYQQRILDGLQEHLNNNHLHLVAPPGSGKTVLGLEVMLRVNKPTLILAPTLTIKDQWASRFTELFLQSEQQPEWVSTNIKRPAYVTITTYQALHSLYQLQKNRQLAKGEELNGLEEEELHEPEAYEQEIESEAEANNVMRQMKEIGFGTIVLDEAHHLRTAWWQSALTFRKQLHHPTVIALTATPPYDVSSQEWDRYIELCGPIDAEISVPELVREGDLCPHQDYIYLSTPQDEESKALQQFHENVTLFHKKSLEDDRLIKLLENHPWLEEPTEHIESILSSPSYYSSMIIFLKAADHPAWQNALEVLGMEGNEVPDYDTEWAEDLLNGILYKDSLVDHEREEVQSLRKELRRIGAIERRNIYLRSTPNLNRSLVHSTSKLNSIERILEVEREILDSNLRMVILTDYIRRESLPKCVEDRPPLKKLGVAPIFELIRRRYESEIPVAILTGSLVIIPKSAVPLTNKCAEERDLQLHYTDVLFDENYVEVRVKDTNRAMIVAIMTDVFTRGGLSVIIGTAALLGEGWDAPVINSLIMASYVGSFMLSNQMRGRAIRVEKGNEQKTASIWHLACVDPAQFNGGGDISSLKRRFRSLIGLSTEKDTVESGISRMNIESGGYTKEQVQAKNAYTFGQVRNRHLLSKRWNQAISVVEEGMTEELQVPQSRVPKQFVFQRTIRSLFVVGIVTLLAIFYEIINGGVYLIRSKEQLLVAFILGVVLGLIYAGPKLWKAVYLKVRHQTLESQLHDVGKVIYTTLYEMELVKPEPHHHRIKTEDDSLDGRVVCWMRGGTTYEKKTFLNAIQQFLDPIENPRYLLYREGKAFRNVKKVDYYAIPDEIGRRKEFAQLFLKNWEKVIGPAELIYTRNTEGRKALVTARMKAMSAAFIKPSERLSAWR